MRHRGHSHSHSGPRSQVLAGEACHPEEILFETGSTSEVQEDASLLKHITNRNLNTIG